MDADDDTTPATTPPEDAPAPYHLDLQPDFLSRQYRADRQLQQSQQADRDSREAAQRRAAERSTRQLRRSRRRVVAETSQSTAEIHGSSEGGEIHGSSGEEGSTIMDTRQHQTPLHEEDQLSDWMSQLFEKLDLEVSKDDESIGEVSQKKTHPLVEGGIASEIHGSLQEKDSTMFEKRELEANMEGSRSLWKVAQGERLPLVEGGIPVETQKSSKWKDPYMAWMENPKYDDEFDNWMLEMMNLDGYEDDVSSLPKLDQEVDPTDSDEFYDLIDKEVKEYCKNMKKNSYRKTIENGFKWMSEECFLAFTKSAEKLNFEGIEHKFGELQSQCFSVESHDKIFHHYNFTVEEKHESSDVWTSKLYFAEVKQLSGVKSYLCSLLEPNDYGHCYGCKSQDVYDLKHPSRGGYEEGDSGICWPFIDDPECDSDSYSDYSDCGGVLSY